MPFGSIASVGRLAVASSFLLSMASAHLIMTNPVPFGKDTLNNSPLVDAAPGSSGSDYPCKQRPGVYDITKMNHMAVGDPQLLTFEGSASHGGGTCQIAVTLDEKPTHESTFKIIQVFEGGCPVNSDDNTGTHPFSFSIPQGFPNGVATLTWVWYNRIGNREIYMNCAPITVTGGSDSKDYYNSLPNLFLINLPTSDCESNQNSAVSIPNPGQFFLKQEASQSVMAASGPQCKASAAAQTKGVQGYKASPLITTNGAYSAPTSTAAAAVSSAGAGTGSSSAGTSAAAPTPAPSSPSAQSGAVSGFVTMSTSASSAAAAPPAPATTQASTPASASASLPAVVPASSPAGVAAPSGAVPSGAASPSSGGSPSGGSCSGSSSSIVCSADGSKFGMCAAGGQMVWQPVAAGTKCENGAIARRHVVRHPHVRSHL